MLPNIICTPQLHYVVSGKYPTTTDEMMVYLDIKARMDITNLVWRT
jgi:hypothetical protein